MLPLLLVATAPLLVTTFAFNFNNYTLIELLTGGGPFPGSLQEGGSTDLLINWTFRQAFGTPQQLGLASAIAMFIFVIVGTVSAYGFRLTRRLEEIGHDHAPSPSPPRPKHSNAAGELKAERMPFGRWVAPGRLAARRRRRDVHLGAVPGVLRDQPLVLRGPDADLGLLAGPQRVPRRSAAWCRTSSTSATTRPC